MSAELLGPTSIAMSQGFSAFQFFLPKLSEVRRASPDDDDMIGDVRMGEVAAIALCIGVGAITSSLTKSAVPTVVAAAVAATLVFVYESALRGDKPYNPKGLRR